MIVRNHRLLYLILGIIVVFLACIHLHNCSLNFQVSSLWKSIANFDDTQQIEIIFREIRIPRTVMAILAGIGLSIAGLLMQTYFNNPLAGPSVLGITSGSSLFVALSVMTGWELFQTDFGLVFSALCGAFLFSILILFFSFYVKSQVSLLIIGMMLGSFTSAIIQVIQMSTHADQLKAFTLWGFGSLQQVNYDQLPLILGLFVCGVFSLIFLIKPLNILVLGEKQATVLGLNARMIRISLIAVTSLFAGLITAYCGPISFIGLAVPNVVKLLFKTQNHLRLLIASALLGALVLLGCDLFLMAMEDYILIPLNGITALIGAPIVIWIILKRF